MGISKKILLSCVLGGGILFSLMPIAYAADLTVPLQIPIVGTLSIPVCSGSGTARTCSGVAEYIGRVYQWLVAFAAVAAVLAFTYGGVLWLIAGGESSKVTESKKVMTNAVMGLLLALLSYSMLWAISPKLVEFSGLTVPGIEPMDLKLERIEELIATHNAVRGRFNLSPGIAVSGFTHVTFDGDSKRDMESPGVLTKILVDLLKNIDAQGFNVKVTTLSSGHNPGSFHNPRGQAADIVGTQEELIRLASYLKANQALLQVNELYYAFNPDAAVEDCIPQDSSYLNSPRHAGLKKDHEDHVHVAVGCGGSSFPKTSTAPVPPSP